MIQWLIYIAKDHGPEQMKGTPRIGTTIPNSGASSDGGSGSGGAGPNIHAGGHANVSISGSDNDNSTHVTGAVNSTVLTGPNDRVCYLPSYEGEQASYTTNSVYETNKQGLQDQHKSGGQQNGSGGQNGGGSGWTVAAG